MCLTYKVNAPGRGLPGIRGAAAAIAAPKAAAAAVKSPHALRHPLQAPRRAAASQQFNTRIACAKLDPDDDQLSFTQLSRPSSITGEHPLYGGSCTLCGGSHWLPCTAEAVSAMQQLLGTIHHHQRLDFDSTPADPRFALHYLFTKGPGRMLGVLLATDAEGLHTLKAFSGQITESWHIPGWVGPVAGIINESPVYVRTRKVIERVSARLHNLEQQQQQQHGEAQAEQQQQQQQQQEQQAGTRRPYSKRAQTPPTTHSSSFQQQQRQLLKRRRRRLSHQLLQQIQHSYVTHTVGAAQQLSLLDVYAGYRARFDPSLPVTRAGQTFVGMPAGVGDCCAPKLLHAAAEQGLMPVALCEVWFGSAPGTATMAKQGRGAFVKFDPEGSSSRQHCKLYGPCDKCRAVLGSMLCSNNVSSAEG